MKLFKNTTQILVSTIVVAIAIPALAAISKLDTSKSTVGIVFKQMNVPVDAKFKKFSAVIDYNAAKPETSKASVEIDLASFDLGDAEYNKEVLKKNGLTQRNSPKPASLQPA